MKRRQFLATIGLALAGPLAACGQNPASVTANDEAASAFLTERNNGTPVAIGSAALDNGQMAGIVERVDGQVIVVRQPVQGTTATIKLTDNGRIYKQVEGALSDIVVGTTITAFGERQEDIYQAQLIQVGGAVGGPMIMTMPGSGRLAPSGNAVIKDTPSEGDASAPLTGTVEQIDGDRLVVKTDGASISIQLVPNGKVQRRGEATATDITVGQFLVAMGEQVGDTFQAAEIELLPTPKMS